MSKNALSLGALAMLAMEACAPATVGTGPEAADPEVQASVSSAQTSTSDRAALALQRGPQKTVKECENEARLRAWADGERNELIGISSIGEPQTPFKRQAAKEWKAADDAAVDAYLKACAAGADPQVAKEELLEKLAENRRRHLGSFSRVQVL